LGPNPPKEEMIDVCLFGLAYRPWRQRVKLLEHLGKDEGFYPGGFPDNAKYDPCEEHFAHRYLNRKDVQVLVRLGMSTFTGAVCIGFICLSDYEKHEPSANAQLVLSLALLDGHQCAGPKREHRVARVPGQGLPVQQGGPKHVHGANIQVAH
jgi:hypothetical protein